MILLQSPKGSFIFFDYVVVFVAIFANIIVLSAVIGARFGLSGYRRFLISLTISDLYICLVNVLTFVYQIWMLYSSTSSAEKCGANFLRALQLAGFFANLLNLCGMSVDHFIGVVYPMQYRYMMSQKLARYAVMSIWILSFALAFLDFPVNMILYSNFVASSQQAKFSDFPAASQHQATPATFQSPQTLLATKAINNSAYSKFNLDPLMLMMMTTESSFDPSSLLTMPENELRSNLLEDLLFRVTTPQSIDDVNEGAGLQNVDGDEDYDLNSDDQIVSNSFYVEPMKLPAAAPTTKLKTVLAARSGGSGGNSNGGMLQSVLSMNHSMPPMSAKYFDGNPAAGTQNNLDNLQDMMPEIDLEAEELETFLLTMMNPLNPLDKLYDNDSNASDPLGRIWRVLQSEHQNLDWCTFFSANKMWLEVCVMVLTLMCFAFLMICYGIIFKKVSDSVDTSGRSTKKLIVTTIILLGAFTICWLPFMTFETAMLLIFQYDREAKNHQTKSFLINFFFLHNMFNSLLMTYPLVDPIIYAVRVPAVRRYIVVTYVRFVPCFRPVLGRLTSRHSQQQTHMTGTTSLPSTSGALKTTSSYSNSEALQTADEQVRVNALKKTPDLSTSKRTNHVRMDEYQNFLKPPPAIVKGLSRKAVSTSNCTKDTASDEPSIVKRQSSTINRSSVDQSRRRSLATGVASFSSRRQSLAAGFAKSANNDAALCVFCLPTAMASLPASKESSEMGDDETPPSPPAAEMAAINSELINRHLSLKGTLKKGDSSGNLVRMKKSVGTTTTTTLVDRGTEQCVAPIARLFIQPSQFYQPFSIDSSMSPPVIAPPPLLVSSTEDESPMHFSEGGGDADGENQPTRKLVVVFDRSFSVPPYGGLTVTNSDHNVVVDDLDGHDVDADSIAFTIDL